MRNLQVINVRWFNATAYYALTLAQALQAHGHESLVLALDQTDTYFQAKKMGLNVQTLDLNTKNPYEQLQLVKKLDKIIADFQPELVNCHRGEAFIHFAWLKNKHNYKLVRTRGDQRLPKNNAVNRYLYNNKADAVISTNSKMYDYLLKQMQTPKEKLHLILGGTDTEKFKYSETAREKIRSQYNYSEQDFVLGLVGRFDYVKGQKEFIDVMYNLHQLGYNFKLLLVGFSTDISRQELEDHIQECKLQDFIQISGKVENIQEYYSAFDLGIISSLYSETIARAAFEFISTKIPLLSTEVGVMPDLLSKEALIPVDNFSLFIKKIILAYELPQFKREILKEQSKTPIDLTTFLEQSLAVYNK